MAMHILLESTLMQAVRFTRVQVAGLATLVTSQTHRWRNAYVVESRAIYLCLALNIAMTWLSFISAPASHCGTFLISLGCFVLINHEINSFLRIIKVEFIVFVLFLLFRLLIFVDVILGVLLRAPVVQ